MLQEKSFLLMLFIMVSIFFLTCNVNEPVNSNERNIKLPNTSPQLAYISLEPRTSLPQNLTAPPERGWPAAGQLVTWKAHIFNNDNFKINGLKYKWFVNNTLFKKDSTDLPEGESEIIFQREWNPQKENIKVQIEIKSTSGKIFSDSLSISSKALTIGFWIDQDIYDYVNSKADVPGFELWAKNQVERWRAILNKTIELDKRNSLAVKDEIRLDRITVLPPGSPYPKDIDTDLIWYFFTGISDSRFLNVGSKLSVINDQTIVFHELLHQRGLIDIYAYQVFKNGPNSSDIKIKDPDGNLAIDKGEFPTLGSLNGAALVYNPTFIGKFLMGSDYRYPASLSEQSIYGLNLFAERRTPRSFDQFGNFIDDLADNNPYAAHVPDNIKLEITDTNNNILKNIFLDVFFDKGIKSYQDVYYAKPDFTLETDTFGIAILNSDPWQVKSWVKRYSASTLILRARYPDNSKWAYQFLPIYYLNLKYINGDTESARINVTFNMK